MAHTLINIAGLSVGLACCLLILLWVQNELGIDAFHKNGPQLYSVYERMYFDQPNVALFYFPFIWLPCFVVPVALFAHLVGIRRLMES